MSIASYPFRALSDFKLKLISRMVYKVTILNILSSTMRILFLNEQGHFLFYDYLNNFAENEFWSWTKKELAKVKVTSSLISLQVSISKLLNIC